MGIAVIEDFETSGFWADDQAVDGDVFGHERMPADGLDAGADAFFDGFEAGEPFFEVDAAVAEGVEDLVGDAALAGLVQDAGAGEAGHATLMVADDGHLLRAQLVDGDED